jgi:myo-inositol-1(or 4)-monophosphatase
MDAEPLIDRLIEAACAGRDAIIRTSRGAGLRNAEQKADGSLLTQADLASHDAIFAALARAFPNVPVLSEEGQAGRPDLLRGQWLVVDPLDGTTNFSRGIPFYSATIAYVIDGQPEAGVVLPVTDNVCYAAARGAPSERIDLATGERAALRCVGRPLNQSVLSITCDQVDAAARERWWRWMAALRPPTCFRLRLMEASALELCWLAAGRTDGYLHTNDKPWDMAAAGLIARQAGATLLSVDFSPWSLDACGVIAATPAIADAVVDGLRGA